MEKLIELSNAGIKIVIFSPKALYDGNWHIQAEKKDDGVELKIETKARDLVEAIDDLYERWEMNTRRGIPTHSLLQIEHIPDDSEN